MTDWYTEKGVVRSCPSVLSTLQRLIYLIIIVVLKLSKLLSVEFSKGLKEYQLWESAKIIDIDFQDKTIKY